MGGHVQRQPSGSLWLLNNAQLGQKNPKQTPPTASTTGAELVCAFILFTANSDLIIQMSQQLSSLVRPGNIFPSSVVQFW